jgi:hypothetical protein
MESFTDAGHWQETEIWAGWDTPEPRIVATLAARPAADANAALIVAAVNSYQQMREVLKAFVETSDIQMRGSIANPLIANALRAMCEQHGYGNVIATASRLWRDKDDNGAFTVGHCVGTLKAQLSKARAALAVRG